MYQSALYGTAVWTSSETWESPRNRTPSAKPIRTMDRRLNAKIAVVRNRCGTALFCSPCVVWYNSRSIHWHAGNAQSITGWYCEGSLWAKCSGCRPRSRWSYISYRWPCDLEDNVVVRGVLRPIQEVLSPAGWPVLWPSMWVDVIILRP